MAEKARVLLLWPGTNGPAAGNFGVPQLVTMATYIRERTGARVEIVDLEVERAFGAVSLPRVFAGPDGAGYDIVAFGCYSSYDYLKCLAIAEILKGLHPRTIVAAGGYHVSARPDEIIEDGSPFDVAIVGEGERPMVKLVESVQGGAPLRNVILGPDAIDDLEELPPTDWSFLERYRKVARSVASQAQVYLSRGCPFDCAFCMEKAKREVSWRAYSVERAIDEIRRLDAFLGLSTWTVYFADALFGMKKSWRRQFLEALCSSGIETRKNWLLIRVDLVEDEDLPLFRDANCSLGFGLESGDPELLSIIRKAGRLRDYLDRMRDVAAKTLELGVPWGANIIVGHPGETEATMRTSAKYMRELFLRKEGTTGFLSVDPFRLYPGSPIDDDRGHYERTYGTRFHRTGWWQDGDQEFLSEWVDPSADLSYRRREELQHELYGPILEAIPKHYAYKGKAAEYFGRAVDEQIENIRPNVRMHYAGRYYAWKRYLGMAAEADPERAADPALAAVSRAGRAQAWTRVYRQATSWSSESAPPAAEGWSVRGDERGPRWAELEQAMVEVPRELFVPLDETSLAIRDVAIALDRTGLASVSAMHAYARSFSLAGVQPGDRVLDLGAGTGYGATILSRLVGPTGEVDAVEIDRALATRAAELGRDHAKGGPVRVWCGDALAPGLGELEAAIRACDRVILGFAVEELPADWIALLRAGVVIVFPRVVNDVQRLTRAIKTASGLETSELEEVRYVVRRADGGDPPARVLAEHKTAPTPTAPHDVRAARARANRMLTVLDD